MIRLALGFIGVLVPFSVVCAAPAGITRTEALRAIFAERSIPLQNNDPVGTAVQLGFVTPDARGNTFPDREINRAEFLKFLTLGYGVPQGLYSRFSDVDPSSWYAPYAGIATRYNLFPNATFEVLQPERVVTAEDMRRVLDILKEHIAASSTPTTPRPLAVPTAAVRRSRRLLLQSSSSSSSARPTTVQSSSTSSARTTVRRTRIQLAENADLLSEVIVQVNRARRAENLSVLQRNLTLMKTAQIYAQKMYDEKFFSHTAPNGEVLKDRLTSGGYTAELRNDPCNCVTGFAFGENLANGQTTAQDVFDDWMNSPAHRAAIMNPVYRDIGVGYYKGLWVQHFGAPVKE